MPMPAAGNQVALADKLYFFTSPNPTSTKCLIWAHGGLLHGDSQYALPPGTTIHYYVPHGKGRPTSPSQAIRAGNGGPDPGYHVTGPANIENYRLCKAVGSGWPKEAFSYHDVEQKMNMNQAFVAGAGGDWCPHVVSVRRRFKMIGKSIPLGEIIDAVQQHNPQIVVFYYGACRDDFSGSAVRSALIRTMIELRR
ncbi:MAG: putative adhesin [Steroidobacteraceae bacterium]